MADRSRKWMITINNPVDHGYDHDKIEGILSKIKNIDYYCYSDEVGNKEHTHHTHIFLFRENPLSFDYLKKRFTVGKIESCLGSCNECRDYVFKEGKWLNDEKGETNLRDTHVEVGVCPDDRQGKRSDLIQLYDMIVQGMSNLEIIDSNPQYIKEFDKLDKVRFTILSDKYKHVWRSVEVIYIFGGTGLGKTRGVMETYNYEAYRVTDYKNPFDAYQGQDVVIFDEYRSQIPLADMLNYLDGYPCELKARYCNKQCCWTKVFIISNWDIRDQYSNVQKEDKRSWDAFLRRIKSIKMYRKDLVLECPLNTYFSNNISVTSNIEIPFDEPLNVGSQEELSLESV